MRVALLAKATGLPVQSNSPSCSSKVLRMVALPVRVVPSAVLQVRFQKLVAAARSSVLAPLPARVSVLLSLAVRVPFTSTTAPLAVRLKPPSTRVPPLSTVMAPTCRSAALVTVFPFCTTMLVELFHTAAPALPAGVRLQMGSLTLPELRL